MLSWYKETSKYFTAEFWFTIANGFKEFGPFAPILLAFMESVIPALPLLMIVTFNISVYGPVLGFIYSYIGTTVGAIVMFTFYRMIFKKFLLQWFGDHKNVKKAMAWVGNKPSSTLFIITAIPFTPSSAINLAYGLSDFSRGSFIRTTIAAKLVMMLGLTLFGTTFKQAFNNPIYIVLSILLLIGLTYLASVIKKRNHMDDIE